MDPTEIEAISEIESTLSNLKINRNWFLNLWNMVSFHP